MIDRTKYLEEDEIKRLKDSAEAVAALDLKKGRRQGIATWMVVDLVLGTGVRVSELAHIKIEDIDFKRGLIRVHRSKKRKKTIDSLALSKNLLGHLKEYIEWTSRSTGPLFKSQRRPEMTAQGLQQIWKQAIRKARLPEEYSIHAARHSVGFHLYRKTGNLVQVQRQLGHASPAVTANFYTDVSFEQMRDGMTGLYGNEQAQSI